MSGKIFAKLCGELVKAEADVGVESFDDVGDRAAGNRLVVGVDAAAPDEGVSLGLVEIDASGETRNELGLVHFTQAENLAANDVIAVNHAGKRADGAVLATRAKSGNQKIANHVDGRRGPAVVFVEFEFDGPGAVGDFVEAINFIGIQAPDNNVHGELGGRGSGSGGNGERVELNGTGSATGRVKARQGEHSESQ